RGCSGLLFGPHVGESGARVVAEMTGLRIATGEDQRVENGFRAARFDRFVGTAVCIGVERRDLAPEANAFCDVVEEAAFVFGGCGFGESRPERGARHGVGNGGMAGDTESFVVALGPGPRHPPRGALIEIAGSGLRTPAGVRGACWRLRAEEYR